RSSVRDVGGRPSISYFPGNFLAWREICWRSCDRPRGAGRRHHTFSVFASRAEIFVAEVGEMKRGALTWCITLSAILCVILTAGWAWAQNAQGLAAVGAINAANGYPRWYMDRNGLQLGQCLDTGPTDPCAVAAELPDPNQPVSFPGNFPPEF